MFRYASRRFGLTLFIATALDTLRYVLTLSSSSCILYLHSRSFLYLFLFPYPLAVRRFLSFFALCLSCALQRLFPFSCNVRWCIYIHKLLARRLACIAASTPDDARDSTPVPCFPLHPVFHCILGSVCLPPQHNFQWFIPPARLGRLAALEWLHRNSQVFLSSWVQRCINNANNMKATCRVSYIITLSK